MTVSKVETIPENIAEEKNDSSKKAASRPENETTQPNTTHSKTFTAQDDALLKSMGIAPASENSESTKPTVNPWAGDIEAYERKPWNETARGRLAIRMASRGILGAAFYAFAQVKGGRDMEGYDPSHSWAEIWTGEHNEGHRKWLQLLAKSFDSTIGNAVKGAVKFITGDEVKAAESVLFRPTRFYGLENPGITAAKTFTLTKSGKHIWGRSLGAEIVGVTYDFAAMSIGDGFAREYLIPLFDPAIEKSWLKKDVSHDASGKEVIKHHLDFSEAGKSFAKATWRLLTYNAGEDWFAGPIYAYYMKWQRNLIDKHSPGFGFDSDRALNGGSFKVNSEGKITGNYNAEGMLDLMGRFSFYNYLTLMYREGYNKVGSLITNYWDTGKFPEHKSPESIADIIGGAFSGAYEGGRYMVKSFFKAYTYMIPASFVFASIRTSQSKDIGLAIHQETKANGDLTSQGPLYFMHKNKLGQEYPSYLQANGSLHGTGKKVEETFEPDINNLPQKVFRGIRKNRSVADPAEVPNPFSFKRDESGDLDKFGYFDQNTRKMDYATNLIGKASHTYGDFYKAITKKIVSTWHGNPSDSQFESNPRMQRAYESAKSYTRRFSKASLAYTPYFFMKTDVLSRAWDNERVDLGLNRTIDGATSFNWGEFKAGLGEWLSGLKNEPFSDPAREALVKKAIKETVATGERNEDGISLSQEYIGIPSGYNYVPSVRANPISPQPRGSFADNAVAAQSLKSIIAGQQAKSTSSWLSKQDNLKEQNAPTTMRIN